jgi:hypothetical protein
MFQKMVSIDASATLWNRTAGLCGNMDGDIQNEFRAKGDSELQMVGLRLIEITHFNFKSFFLEPRRVCGFVEEPGSRQRQSQMLDGVHRTSDELDMSVGC